MRRQTLVGRKLTETAASLQEALQPQSDDDAGKVSSRVNQIAKDLLKP